MRPDAVVFDLDGTLVDSAPDIHASLNAVLAQRGCPPLQLEAVQMMIGDGPELLVSRALAAHDVEAEATDVTKLTAEFRRVYLERGSPLTTFKPGALDLLELLADRRIPMGICSNKPENICEASLVDLGVRHFFRSVRGSGTGLPLKPDPAVLHTVIDTLGSHPASTIYVGDSRTDAATGRAAGVATALVSSGYSATPPEQLGADWVVDHLARIPAIWSKAVA